MMHWDNGWDMGFGGIFMIAFWALVILGIVYLIRFIAGGSKGGQENESALDILKKRYAKGEISKEEFENKKKDIV